MSEGVGLDSYVSLSEPDEKKLERDAFGHIKMVDVKVERSKKVVGAKSGNFACSARVNAVDLP